MIILQLFLNYITPYLYKEVITEVSIKDYGPDILADIFYFIYTMFPVTMDYFKDTLK